jgi:LuxR family maltose regulon positive regulatory protein
MDIKQVQETNLPAKLIRPHISGVLLRERLFKKFDVLRSKPTIWVSASGGAGKTSLVSSYIETRSVPCLWYQLDKGDEDPATFFHFLGLAGKHAARLPDRVLPQFTCEYFLDIDSFSRYFFTELYNVLAPASMLVFDNCQEIAEESGLFDIILAGQARMGVGMNIVFICRKGVPVLFSRQRANRRLGIIDWQDLRFTLNEFKELASQFGIELDGQELHRVFTRLDGWAAGLPLLFDADTFRAKTTTFDQAEAGSRDTLFDYFTREIFEYLDTESQQILLKTCLLPYVDEKLAKVVCEHHYAFATLQHLFRSNIFISLHTTPREIYQFHQLFKEFLQDRSRLTLATETINSLRCRAARSLLDDGQPEEAATLFIQANNLPALKSLITEQASLLLKQGRFQTLAGWLNQLPDAMIMADPWLLYWQGMCLMLRAPLRAKHYLNLALEVFEQREDRTGLYITMLGVADSLSYGFDSFTGYDLWIDTMEGLLAREQPPLPPEIEIKIAIMMLAALALRQPKHPRTGNWRDTLTGFLEKTGEFAPDLRLQMLNPLILHSILTGALAEARLYLDSFRSLTQAPEMVPLAIITLKNFEALYHWRCGNSKKCVAAVESALRLSDRTGIHIMTLMLLLNGASGALVAGDTQMAGKYLERVGRQLDNAGAYVRQLYHLSMSWVHLLEENSGDALVHGEKSAAIGSTSGNHEASCCSLLACAMALQQRANDNDRITFLLEQALNSAQTADSPYVEFACLFFFAYFRFATGEREEGIRRLNDALSLGRRNNYHCFPLWRSTLAEEVCSIALNSSIEVEFVRRLAQRRGLKISRHLVQPGKSPWALRIYCLGRFNIVRKGQPFQSARKTGQKPFTMLKALISAGGCQVPVSIIAEFLWPEADGDMQIQNFNTTLHRLRKLLGVRDALVLKSGQLTLNIDSCWVDAWRFEQLVEKFERETEECGTIQASIASAEEALSLFHGPFLDSEPESWAIPVRERLTEKLIGLVERLSAHYFLEGERGKAIEYCKRGLALAPFVEDLYHKLMLYQEKTGQNAAALQTYQAYNRIVVEPLGISPSEKMKAMSDKIRSDG